MLSFEHPETTDPNNSGHFFHHVPVADRPGDGHRRFWTEWIDDFCLFGANCTEHLRCWGNTILRTSYDDDDKFALAVAAIRRLAMIPIELDYEKRGTGPDRDQPAEPDGPEVEDDVRIHIGIDIDSHRESLQKEYQNMVRRARRDAPPGIRCTHDWVITHDLMSRYHNIVVEDRQALEDADDAAASHYFNHSGCSGREHGMRGAGFVLLDREAIDHLAAAPGEQELASMTLLERAKASWQHWIKFVSADRNTTDDPMCRRRIRMFDYVDIFLYLQDCEIGEIGFEGNDYERFPGYGDREWEFCINSEGCPEARPWLEDLYGEYVGSWCLSSRA